MCYIWLIFNLFRMQHRLSILCFAVLFLTACQPDISEDTDAKVAVYVDDRNEQEVAWDKKLDECKAANDIDCQVAVYREMYDAGNPEAGFKIDYLYRLSYDPEASYAILDEIGEDYPDLMGRITYYKGGVAIQADDFEKAKEFYALAADEYGDLLLGGNPVGIIALKSLAARTAVDDREAAGQIYRRIIHEYSEHINSVSAYLEDAIAYETLGMELDSYSYSGACGKVDWNYCLFADGKVTGANEVPDGFVSLTGSDTSTFWFKLSEKDLAILDQYN